MCYTSGTTGEPKGVLYSHRSNVLHAMIACMPDAMGISSRDVILPVVPMFHANAWGLAQAAPMIGAKMVMPGGKMDGASIYELLDTEKVTFSAAVPTVWLMLLQHLEETGKKLPHLKKVVIGGSACPRMITQKFQDDYDVEVIHAWGMTEMSPLGTLATLKPEYDGARRRRALDIQQKQGHSPFGVEMKVDRRRERRAPWNGKTFGRLKVRGPAVARAYYGGAGKEQFDEDGWFDTGDVAHIDANGYMQITDRAKDVIKSGGEWISTIELENLAVGHPDVAEAAVIGVPHSKWAERPLLVIVRKPGKEPAKAEILGFMDGKVAKWWMPDDVAFVDEIPHTATGKILNMGGGVDVHAGVAVGQPGHVEGRAGRGARRVERWLDLRPGRAAVGRTPDAAGVRSGVHDLRVDRVELGVAYAARRAGAAVGSLGRVGGALRGVGRTVSGRPA